jgi:hypothetical protein
MLYLQPEFAEVTEKAMQGPFVYKMKAVFTLIPILTETITSITTPRINTTTTTTTNNDGTTTATNTITSTNTAHTTQNEINNYLALKRGCC